MRFSLLLLLLVVAILLLASLGIIKLVKADACGACECAHSPTGYAFSSSPHLLPFGQTLPGYRGLHGCWIANPSLYFHLLFLTLWCSTFLPFIAYSPSHWLLILSASPPLPPSPSRFVVGNSV
ncbi:hypothetical protein HOY80DRAFT_946140 [Tuber brumale]|nr:hypothetical protein HOY80DRAFT_946140 [Tuber brumale]